MPDIDRFLEDLASSEPAPGGGAASAYAAAMGAALVTMAGRLTRGPRFAGVQGEVDTIVGEADGLRRRAQDLATEDETAYVAVSRAMALPRSGEAEKEARRQALQNALKGAVQPPLDLMWTAQGIVRSANRLAGIGNPALISDVASGSLLAAAAFHAARLNVEANLVLIRDRAWMAEIRRILQTMSGVDGWNAETQAAAVSVMSREGR